MDFHYTINQIANRCKVSITSINNLKKKNQDFINKNSMRRQHKIYYNQAAMDFFVSYYIPEQDQEEGKIPTSPLDLGKAEAKAENSALENSSTDKPQEREEEVTKAEIGALKAEIEALKKQLEQTEAEKKELFRQNSQLLLLLQQEKQEKMLLLPAPKKSFSEKVKSIFKGKPQA